LPKKTLGDITSSGNDYLVKVKRNQRSLLKAMEQVVKTGKSCGKSTVQEKNKGRQETRKLFLYPVSEYIEKEWPKAKFVVLLERRRIDKGKEQVSAKSYYLTSRSAKAKDFAQGIRHHWGIENRLHYVKDVSFREDASRIRTGNAPEILSLIRNITINSIRMNSKSGIKKYMRLITGNIKLIKSILE